MHKVIETQAAPPAFSAYAQAVEVPPGARTVVVSGMVGMTPEGHLPHDPAAQHAQVWHNIAAVLARADMELSDIYEVFAIVREADGVPLYRVARDAALDGHLAASTLIVAGLAHPDWAVEVMVRAARAA